MTIRASIRISVFTDQSQSLDQQRFLISRWAEYKRPGEPIEWYADPGVSGGMPLSQRPKGNQLLRDLRSGDTLAVIKIDRLARSVRDLLDVIEYCEQAGASFVATEQDVSTEGAYGRFMLTLLGALAELERGIVSERVKAARAQFLRDGRYGVGRLPYGFIGVKDKERGWLVVRPHPDEGPKLREAVLNVINGATQRSQADALGMPEPSFRGLLTNPRLYGQTPGDGGKLDKNAGIISMTEWRKLQARIGGPRSWSRADGYGAVLFCYQCDTHLYLDTYNDYYRCEGKHPRRPTVRRPMTDDFLENWYLDHYGSDELMELVDVADGNGYEEALAEIEIKLETLGQQITAPGANVTAFASEITELHQQRKDTLARSESPVVQQWVPKGHTAAEAWAEADNDERVTMLKRRIRVVLWPAQGYENDRTEDWKGNDSSVYRTVAREGRYEVQEREIVFARPKPVALEPGD